MHDAVLYRDFDELRDGIVPFLLDGLAAGDPVLVAAPPPTLELLRTEHPDAAGRIRMVDLRQAGRNPGRIIAAVLHPFAAAHRGRRVRIIGEPYWPDRIELEYAACVQHEALINVVFHAHDAMIRCPYPAGLPQRWLDAIARTHPLVGTGKRIGPSPGYSDPLATVAAVNSPLPAPPAGADRMAVRPTDLAELRWRVAEYVAGAGMPDHRVADLTIAVSELAANGIQHGEGQATVALWDTGAEVVCQVSDAGHITDPLAGRIPPAPDAPGGRRGLVLVNAVCDLVRVYSRPGRTTVEVRMRH